MSDHNSTAMTSNANMTPGQWADLLCLAMNMPHREGDKWHTVIATYFAQAKNFAAEVERARCAKEAERTAQRDFCRLPLGQFALAQEVSMAAAKAIHPKAYATDAANNG